MKVGDLVIKVFASNSDWRALAGAGAVSQRRRAQAGLGIVIEIAARAPAQSESGARYKVLWSNNYGTFWSPRNKLELLNGSRGSRKK